MLQFYVYFYIFVEATSARTPLRQEAEGLRKSLEHSDAYFLVQQQALEDFSAKQDKANQLAKLIASMVDTQDNVS